MSKMENKGEELLGRGKEAAGAATGNQSLKNEGKADQGSAKMKQGVEDAANKVTEGIDKLRGR